ncbi:MAG TPA: dynamin family protein, partial [Hyphomicrobiaceae bacterium]|nr:dynamin family protein [Hyphomicrobiaceae bacterium]
MSRRTVTAGGPAWGTVGAGVAQPLPSRPKMGLPPPVVTVIGEFRSGRSSLVNALLGVAALPTSLRTSIPHPVMVSYASRVALVAEFLDRRRQATDWQAVARLPQHGVRCLHLRLPLASLKSMRVTDTPACAADGAPLDERVLASCRRAQAVIWCTPAVQAWKASEREIWLQLPERVRKRGVLAVTYLDLLRSESERARLASRLRSEAAPYFAGMAMIATVEAARARQQQSNGWHTLWQASGGAEL